MGMIVFEGSGKKGEINPSVFPVLQKSGMGRKGVVSRMFKNENPLVVQYFRAHYQIWKIRNPRMIVGRVGKNNVKGLDGFMQVSESVCPKYGKLVQLQVSGGLLNEFKMYGCLFDGEYRPHPSGSKFIGNASGPGKEVQHIHFLQIILMDQDVEKTLFCEIGGGPGFKICRRPNLLPS
jgi:hypothetical protein